jgi:Na+-translocating ferredoxin:NAD+ oxidoreductase RNF subunit RnfB
MVIAMYIAVLALVAFLYGVMYRTDSKRMRHNWERYITNVIDLLRNVT